VEWYCGGGSDLRVTGCDKVHEVESVWHFLLVCSRWSIERELLVANVMVERNLPRVEGAPRHCRGES
jgi:hypothetical protein